MMRKTTGNIHNHIIIVNWMIDKSKFICSCFDVMKVMFIDGLTLGLMSLYLNQEKGDDDGLAKMFTNLIHRVDDVVAEEIMCDTS